MEEVLINILNSTDKTTLLMNIFTGLALPFIVYIFTNKIKESYVFTWKFIKLNASQIKRLSVLVTSSIFGTIVCLITGQVTSAMNLMSSLSVIFTVSQTFYTVAKKYFNW